MKICKILLYLNLILAISIPSIHIAYADVPPAKTVIINPSTLQGLLLSSNLTIKQEEEQVHIAKDTVLVNRGNLLPKLNLGTMITSITSGPAFILSSISVLLPFLFPSNWANLHQSEHQLEAEKSSYYIVQLNQYASAYSIYATMLGDIALREVLNQQYNDLSDVRNWLQQQKDLLGTVPQIDIDNADAQARLAFDSLSQMDELLIKEKASLREMLSLGINDIIQLDPTHVDASPMETADMQLVINKVQELAPENKQNDQLIEAAKEARISKEWSFLGSVGGASLSAVPGGGSNTNSGSTSGVTSFDKLNLGTTSSIGFDYGPNIQLSSDNIVQLQLHSQELKLQQVQLVEATLGSIVEAKKQQESDIKAEQELIAVYKNEFTKYTWGLSNLYNVFQAEDKVAQASAAKVKSLIDLDTLRITLHRELLTDQFAYIPQCGITLRAEAEDSSLFGSIKDWSIDDICSPKY